MQTNKFPFGSSFGYQIYHKCKQQPPFSTKRTLGHLFQEVNRAELEENCELCGTDNHSDPIIQTQYMSKGKYPSMFWLWTGPFVDFLPGVKKTLVIKLFCEFPDCIRTSIWLWYRDEIRHVHSEFLSNLCNFVFHKVVFEGIKGTSYTGDIAIDDVKIMNGSCPTPGDCSFDDGMCTWTNSRTGDVFDWIIGGGGTPSFFTGPSSDHTTGNGRFAF